MGHVCMKSICIKHACAQRQHGGQLRRKMQGFVQRRAFAFNDLHVQMVVGTAR